jgi:threonine aldolase
MSPKDPYRGATHGMSGDIIDLRSDTVTRPTAAMRDAMFAAPVGDDVYGEDPTVNLLEEIAAERLGKDAALFVSSGTQSNLIAILAHCARGEEVLIGDGYHVFAHEARGSSVLGGVSMHPLTTDGHGGLTPQQVTDHVKADDPHFPMTKLLSLENTVSGAVQPADLVASLAAAARAAGLAVHLDGARVANAAVATGQTLAEAASSFDTVSVCLSKGLGAPVGSVLCGPTDLIHRGRRLRKMLGGGMRQAGFLAAAGIYALEHHIDRLADDHALAARLATGLSAIEGLGVKHETNMVFIDPDDMTGLRAHLATSNIVVAGSRLVVHLDITSNDVDTIIAAVAAFHE